ncbi:MAG: OmpA family protein [Alphaproteobacteria bacterium]|nr:OmpA family protein [Alphaproteobacteria bacterium]
MRFISTSRNIACMLCASSALVACSYFQTDEQALQLDKNTIETVDLAGPQGSSLQKTLPELVSEATEGRVQLYSLDDEPQDIAPLSAHMSDELGVEGIQSSNAREIDPARAVPVDSVFGANDYLSYMTHSSSVQIFSLDDGYENVPVSIQEMVMPSAALDLNPAIPADPAKTVVYFDHGSAILNTQGRQKVDGVASRFNVAAGRGLLIEGHASVRANYADAAQRSLVNLKISLDRALAVSRALIERGIPAEAIKTVGWGDARPPMQVEGMSAEAAARRVEISG